MLRFPNAVIAAGQIEINDRNERFISHSVASSRRGQWMGCQRLKKGLSPLLEVTVPGSARKDTWGAEIRILTVVAIRTRAVCVAGSTCACCATSHGSSIRLIERFPC